MKSFFLSSRYTGQIFIFLLCFAAAFSVSAQDKVLKVIYQNYGVENKPFGKLKTTVYISNSISVSLLQLDYYYELGKQMLKTETGNAENIQKTSVVVRPEDTIKRYIYKDLENDRLYFETNRSIIYPLFKTFSDSLHNMKWTLNEKEKKLILYCVSRQPVFSGAEPILPGMLLKSL